MNNLERKIKGKTIRNRALVDTDLIDVESRTMPVIMVSDDNGGIRYDWWEGKEYLEILEPNGAKFDELNTFFTDHQRNTQTAIGKIINPRIEGGQVKADVVFGSDDDSTKIMNKYKEGILTDVSIGYEITAFEEIKKEKETDEVRVTDYNIVELSAVWKGFDKKAKVSREQEERILKSDEIKRRLEKKYKVIKLSQ